jgi:(R,R)-butanediol dehydrogenase / meso-butanediol dehydrogenase / diacetyl reductase
MICARLYGREDLRIEEIAEPEPGSGEVKIAVAHNGLCGTDLREYFEGPMACTDEPHPLTGGVLPQIMGHEFAGVVQAVGSEVENVAIGDRVCVEPLYYCGDCEACRAGLPELCRMVITHGICSEGGGLAQFTVVPSWMVHRLPASMSLAEGALVEPLAVAFNGVLRSGAEPGKSALVFGAGPIGIGVVLGLRAIGVEDILVVEPAPSRRAAMEALGVEHVIDPTDVDLGVEVRSMNGGRGVDVALDCAGVASTFSVAPAVLRPRGRYVILAVLLDELPFVPWFLAKKEVELTGSCGYGPGVFTRVIELIADRAYPTRGWVEHVDLGEVHSAMEDLRAGRRTKLLVNIPAMSP